MGNYSKNIAVIRGIKSGFSVDGGQLSGLIKAEKYGSSLKVEVSLINFAPLSEGRYVTALSDGKRACIIEGTQFEGASEVDTSAGFAALVCFVNGAVSPVAAAVCGNFRSAVIGLKEEVEKQELLGSKTSSVKYEDEALAEENYYEYEPTFKDGGTVCENVQEEKDGRVAYKDETPACPVKSEKGQIDAAEIVERADEPLCDKAAVPSDEGGAAETACDYGGSDEGICNDGVYDDGGAEQITFDGYDNASAEHVPLARGICFYERMKGEIDGVLSAFPAEEGLERVVENSRWVRINYGDGKFYVFGVIYGGGKPQYICYGVPSSDSARPPESLSGLASFIPADPNRADEGYWVMYQDAATGASVKISAE